LPGALRKIRRVRLAHAWIMASLMGENAATLQKRLMHVGTLAIVREMASGIAHELNQPLAAIASYAHACDRLLGLSDPDIGEVQAALREIAGQAVRAGDIIQRLRNLAKVDELHSGAAEINSVIAELTDLIEPDATARGVAYRLELSGGLPELAIDRGLIQQVILNLIRNALEAIEVGQVKAGHIVVRTRHTGEGDVEISVADNGPGVSADIVERIFDPFRSTKPSRIGLGLAISRTIVRAHDGILQYRPNHPVGARFVVTLRPSR
jgi:two-component system sensor kinase FixL